MQRRRGDFRYGRDFPKRFLTYYRVLFAIKALLRWLRVQKPVTQLLGFQYQVASDLIEIDLTYLCNLRCNNCNRSSAQAPAPVHLSLIDIRRFVDESLAARRDWVRIRLLGGEPKPTRFYHADYDAPRQKGGGNTWTHLRAFTKALFDQVPVEEYKIDGEWIADISDYATMLPMAELATAPVHLEDQYYVWHEREEYSEDRKRTQAHLISLLLSRSPLQKTGAGSAAAGTT